MRIVNKIIHSYISEVSSGKNPKSGADKMTKKWWKEDEIKTSPNMREEIIDGVLITTFGNNFLSRQYNPPSDKEKRLQSMTRREFDQYRINLGKKRINLAKKRVLEYAKQFTK